MKMSFFGGNMSKNGVERVLNRLKMSGHLVVATIGSPGTVSSGSILLDSGPNQSLIPFLNE